MIALNLPDPTLNVIETFLGDRDARLFRRDKSVGPFSYVEFTASHADGIKHVYGHGQDETAHGALLKSICENYERQAMLSFFRNNPVENFGRNDSFAHAELRTSNGWAIHTDRKLAERNAVNEAIERHVLIYSFLKDGWQAFSKVAEVSFEGVKFTSLLCKYTCNGIAIGLVIAKPSDCLGVTFGSFSENADMISGSKRWLHALFEAKGQLDGHRDLSKLCTDRSIVKDTIVEYLHSDWNEPTYSRPEKFKSLPRVRPAIEFDSFTDSGNNVFEVCRARGGGLIPLFFIPSLTQRGSEYIAGVLSDHRLTLQNLKRIPVL